MYSSRGVVVFGVGMLVVMSLWCMKSTSASDEHESEEVPVHIVSRHEEPSSGGGGGEGCNSKHTLEAGASEECTDEDDSLGLYSDVDDTFRAIKNKVVGAAHHLHEGVTAAGGDNDDSPDIAHNNVNVLGH